MAIEPAAALTVTGDVEPQRDAIGKLDREHADELLTLAVRMLSSIETARTMLGDVDEPGPDERRAGDVGELPVASP